MGNTSKWNEAESLQLIRSMIESTKYQLADNMFLFFLWGYATLVCAIIHYFFAFVLEGYQAYFVWLAMPIIAVIHFFYIKKNYYDTQVSTYAGKVLNGIWSGIGMGILVLIIAAFNMGWEVVYPMFMLLYGIASFATGKALGYRVLTYGGIVSIFCSGVAFYMPFQYQLLLLMAAIIFSYILPAHLMKLESQ